MASKLKSETETPIAIDPVSEELQRCELAVQTPVSAMRIWQRLLSALERDSLGGDFEKAYRQQNGAIGIWMRLRGVSQTRATIDLARALNHITEETQRWLLRATGEGADDPQESLAKAIAQGHLVLVETPREAYWGGKKIDINWEKYDASWSFFWELCSQAKIGRGVDRTHFSQKYARSYVSKAKHKLTSHVKFPTTLREQIVPFGRGTQKINLPPASIRIFEVSTIDSLRERNG